MAADLPGALLFMNVLLRPFETSGSNLAFNTPAYPYGIDYGYGMRTEIGTATFLSLIHI